MLSIIRTKFGAQAMERRNVFEDIKNGKLLFCWEEKEKIIVFEPIDGKHKKVAEINFNVSGGGVWYDIEPTIYDINYMNQPMIKYTIKKYDNIYEAINWGNVRVDFSFSFCPGNLFMDGNNFRSHKFDDSDEDKFTIIISEVKELRQAISDLVTHVEELQNKLLYEPGGIEYKSAENSFSVLKKMCDA